MDPKKAYLSEDLSASNFKALMDKASYNYAESEKSDTVIISYLLLSYALNNLYGNAKALHAILKKEELGDSMVQTTWKIIFHMYNKDYDKALTLLTSPCPKLELLFSKAAQFITQRNWEFIRKTFTSIHKKTLSTYGIPWNTTEFQKKGCAINGDFLIPKRENVSMDFDPLAQINEVETVVSTIEN